MYYVYHDTKLFCQYFDFDNYSRQKLKKDKSRSTSNMQRHIQRNHANCKTSKHQLGKQTTLVDVRASHSSKMVIVALKYIHCIDTNTTHFQLTFLYVIFQTYTHEKFENSLLEFILLTDQPFVTVDNQAFKNMMHIANQNAKIPSATTIKRRVESLFEVEEAEIKAHLQVKSFSKTS